jgi:hypothetical protein
MGLMGHPEDHFSPKEMASPNRWLGWKVHRERRPIIARF